ncbi:MAG: outer membrane protein assembly factor BamA [Calditrichaeota bacterium]|nr:MAG: outer membrane protein assembly factor BamA [Calditrichota bacterium]
MEDNVRKIGALILLHLLLTAGLVYAQGQKIVINAITVEGNKTADASTIRLNSGLVVGESITGDDIQKAVKNLWSLNIFEDIQVYIVNQSAAGIDLLIKVKEYPRLNKVFISGADELGEDDIREALNTYRGMVVTPYKISKMKERVLKKYKEEGFLLAEVAIDTVHAAPNRVNLKVDIKEGYEVQIEKITFHNNASIDGDDLRDAMEDTQEDRWWRSADFDAKKYEADKEKVIQYYKEQGYRDADIVKDSLYYSPDKRSLFIDIWVYEGNKYYFGDIAFEGNEVFSDEELAAALDIRKGDVYDQKKYDEGIRDRLQKMYYNEGYLFANIAPQEVPVHNDTLNVTFHILEGTVVHIKEIDIVGNTKTNEKVIRREFKIHPGDVFNSAKLERSVRDLMILNYFSNVVPDVKLIPNDSKHVNLKVKVDEKSTDTANMSAGYSQRDGLIGSIGLTFNNFSLAHPLSGGDGQRLVFDWQFGRIYRSISISFTEPWMFDTPTLGGFSLFNTRSGGGFYPWDRRDQGGTLRIGRRFYWPDNYFRGDWIFRAAETSITNIRDAELQRRYEQLGTAGTTSQFSLTQIITRDSRNNPEFPTRGSTHSLSFQLSGGPFGGDQHFFKTQFSSEWFIPLPFNLVLYTQNKFGILNQLKDDSFILFGEYFYMGGSGLGFAESLRGYDDGQVGPLTSAGRPIGGKSMVKSTIELRFPIAPNPTIFGLLFAEAGNAWENVSETNPFELRRSVGAGVRLFMPLVGIIGIDFGYGFDYYDATGKRSGDWKVHFQFGRF